MVFEVTTTLSANDVFDRALPFFAERAPSRAAFLEKRSGTHLVLRGQGGEEIVIATQDLGNGRTGVRGSTLLFDHLLSRFLTTLPVASEVV